MKKTSVNYEENVAKNVKKSSLKHVEIVAKPCRKRRFEIDLAELTDRVD